MGVVSIDDKPLKIASTNPCKLNEKHPEYNQYNALLRRYTKITSGNLIKIPLKPQITFGAANVTNVNGCSSVSCIGMSVVDLLVRRPKLFTFKEACAILEHCDAIRDRNFIESIIIKYSVVIKGLPNFPEEDLHLAVYFFIEDMFGIQVNIDLCVRIKYENYQDNIIGVVFDNVAAKETILKKISILDDTGIAICFTSDINWIANELCDDEKYA